MVHTPKYNVEVLGTTFNVEAYSTNPEFKTILYEGKVRLFNESKKENVFLNTNQTAQLVNGKLNILKGAEKNSIQWKNGIIYIDHISFENIMKLFEKYYDKHIVIHNNQVIETAYRGKFRIADGIEHALHVLQKDFPFTYTIDEDSNLITIL